MKKIILPILTENGFELTNYDEVFDCIATKEYNTPLGLKEAQVYLSKGDEYNRTISCTYFSTRELRTASLIPVDADNEKIVSIINEFVLEAHKMIDESFSNKTN